MLSNGAWYRLPDGTPVCAVRVKEEPTAWSLESVTGKILYVIRRGVFRSIAPVDPINPVAQAYVLAACDLTIDDLTPESGA